MKLTSTLLVFIVMLLFCGAIFGQASVPVPKATPDFNGQWRLKKTEYGYGGMGPKIDKEDIVIVHKDAILVKKISGMASGISYAFEKTYYTDNRGETNSIQGSPVDTVVTKTQIKKDVLVTKGFMPVVGDTKRSTNPFHWETRLSKDGKELTIKSCTYFGHVDILPGDICTVSTYTRVE